MNKLVTYRRMAVVLSLFAPCAALATDWTWKSDVRDNTPFTAYDFTEPSNWTSESGYPSTTSDAGIFKENATRYVKVPSAFTVKQIKASGSLRLLCEDEVSLTSLTYSNYTYPVLTLFAEKVNAAGTELGSSVSDIAADIDAKGTSVVCGGDAAGFRWDLYANSADAVRVDPIRNMNRILMGSGGAPRFYAPRGSAAQTTTWRLRAGSPYAELVGTAVVISPGALVTGGGFPSGTFIRRRITTTYIELSEAASADSESAELTFAAFSPTFTQSIPKIYMNVTSSGSIGFGKYRPEDSATIDVAELSSDSARFGGFWTPLDYAGHLILRKISFSNSLSFPITNVDIEFGARTDDGALGFPANVTAYQKANTDKAVFTVAEGLEAAIPSFTNAIGTVTKCGAGLLSMSIGDTSSTKELVVEAGTLDLGATDITVAKLTVKAGATLKTAGSVKVTGSKTFEEGATVVGNVYSYVRKALTGGPLVLARPGNAATMPGNPAFWVNTDHFDTDFEYTVEDGKTNVTRWCDCRGNADAGYNFATNFAKRPVLKNFWTSVGLGNELKAPALEIGKDDSTLAGQYGLAWARPERVRALFLVANVQMSTIGSGDGGGCLLGSTAAKNPWGRAYKPLFESSFVADAIKNGEIYVNGKAVTWQYEIANGYAGTSSSGQDLPVIFEVYPKDAGVLADAFGRNGNRFDLSGGQRIFECVVYTNELSYAERMQACEYLGNKWLGAGADLHYVKDVNLVDSAAADGAEFEVTSGAMDIKKVTGGGYLAKTGAGELLIEDCVAPDATVKAKAGRLVLKSYLPSRDALPYDSSVHLHVDAEDTASITFKDIADKGRCVSKMTNVRGSSTAKATSLANSPLLRYSEGGDGEILAGRPYVDMGEFRCGTNYGADTIDNGSSEILKFDQNSCIRSIFLVMGSHHGGGIPIGWSGKWDNYWTGGFFRCDGNTPALPATASTPIVPSSGGYYPRTGRNGEYGVTRLNGVKVNPASVGYSGKFDLVSHTFRGDSIKANAFACEHYNNWCGGLELSEAILSTKWHSPEETKLVEAYLNRKWFGKTTEGFRQAEIGTLEIAPGATVETLGNAPIKVGRVSGGGTLSCPIEFADGAAVSVDVSNGGITPVTLTNVAGFGDGGTITLVGDTSALQDGDYTVLVANGITAGQVWTVMGVSPSDKRVFKAVPGNGSLLLRVTKRGLTVIVR